MNDMETKQERIDMVNKIINNIDWDLFDTSHLKVPDEWTTLYVLYLTSTETHEEILLQSLCNILNIDKEKAEDLLFITKLSNRKVVLRISNDRKELNELSKLFSVYNISTNIAKINL